MIIDTADNVSHRLPYLKGRGVVAIGRYYSSSSWKRLTHPEAVAISDAGFKLFAVFENNGDPDLTVEQGVHDAQIASVQAMNIGQPSGSTIYFALEHLPSGYTADDVPGALDYFDGIREVLGDRYDAGVYSDGVICDMLLKHGLCVHAWLSASTSFEGSKAFDASGQWSLAQRRIDQNWGGLSIDTNDAKPIFGQWDLKPAATAQSPEAAVPNTDPDIVSSAPPSDQAPAA